MPRTAPGVNNDLRGLAQVARTRHRALQPWRDSTHFDTGEMTAWPRIATGTAMEFSTLIGGGEGGEERSRKVLGGHKDDKSLQELAVPDRFKWVPEAVRTGGAAYDVGQMWVKFAEAIRSGTNVEPDFDHAVRRHRMLDAIVRASQTGQRQKVGL